MQNLLDEKLTKKSWENYVLQSSLAALVLYIGLKLPFMSDAVIIAAIGSTAFIVFAMPSSKTSKPRNVLGGHFVCGLIGLFANAVFTEFIPLVPSISIGVGLAIFFMVVLDVEHPPAGGTVIFLTMTPNLRPFISLLLLASILSLISYSMKHFMGSYLKDLV